MYKDDIVIAVKHCYSPIIEPLIEEFGSYVKRHKSRGDFFTITTGDWEPDFEPISKRVVDALDKLPEESFAFIRLGDDYQDNEIRGYPEVFNMELVREVKY